MADDIRIIKGYRVKRHPDGRLETLGPANGPQPVTMGRPAPTAPLEVPKMQGEINKTETDIVDTREDNRRADLQLEAELFQKGLRIGANGGIEAIPGWQPRESDKPATVIEQENKDKGKRDKSRIVRSIMSQVLDHYKSDIQGQPASRLFGLTEKIDSLPRNERFSKTANGMLALIRPMVAMGAKDGDSDKEMEVFMSYIPNSDDSDLTIEAKLRNLEMLLTGVAGGQMPSEVDLTGRIPTPFVDGALGYDAKGDPYDPKASPQGSVWDKTYYTQGDGPGLAAPNATERAMDLPEAYQRDYDNFVMGGGWSPEQYAAFRTMKDREHFGESAAAQYETYLTEGQRILDQQARGGTINTRIGGPTVSMTEQEKQTNKDAQGDLGSFFIGMGNGLSAGGLEALEGERMALSRENAPLSSMGGEVLGALTTTGGFGLGGRLATKAVAPSLLKGGGKAQFGRNLGTDMSYGAAYGGMTEGDPITGAIEAGVGSTGGQVVGSTLGRTIGGAQLDEASRILRDKGVSLMPGQALRNRGWTGKALNRMEEVAESIPGLGQLIRTRREDSFRDFGRAAFNDGLSPIGKQVRNIGEEGVQEALDASSQSFEDTFSGVNLTPDSPYISDVNNAVNMGSQGKFGQDFTRIMDDDIAPLYGPGGILSGRGVQDMLEVTGDNSRYYGDLARGKAAGAPREPQARPVANAFGQINEGTEGLIGRQAPEVLPNYANAKEAYRNSRILQDATNRARNGTRSGEVGIFTPSQLADASAANAKKYGNTQGTPQQPFRELTRAGQDALPSTLPNSGTFDRAIAAGMTTVPLAGTAYAYNEGLIDPETAAAIAAVTSIYTRAGQQVTNRALFDRPDVARLIGNQVRKRKGLFGSAAVVPAIAAE